MRCRRPVSPPSQWRHSGSPGRGVGPQPCRSQCHGTSLPRCVDCAGARFWPTSLPSSCTGPWGRAAHSVAARVSMPCILPASPSSPFRPGRRLRAWFHLIPLIVSVCVIYDSCHPSRTPSIYSPALVKPLLVQSCSTAGVRTTGALELCEIFSLVSS